MAGSAFFRRHGWREAAPWVAALFFCLSSAEGQLRRAALSAGEVEVLSVRGTVQRIPAGLQHAAAVPVSPGDVVQRGERLLTGTSGYLLLGLPDSSTVEVEPNTELEILDFTGNLRELLQIWMGKVRLKIRKFIGAPNPYQMYSPIATIGVRGTEFEIEVTQDHITTVRVWEGLVGVRNRQRPSEPERLVVPGEVVTVFPLRGPESPVRLEQVMTEHVGSQIPVEYNLLERFLAFPDPHLDLADNPAYAGWIVRPSGRIYIFPARSHSWLSPEIPALTPLARFYDLDELFATEERSLRGVSTRISYVYPFDRWIVGGTYQFSDVRENFDYHVTRQIPSAFGGVTQVEQIGRSVFAPNLSSTNDSHRATFLLARRFSGKTLAFSLDEQRSRGNLATEYQFVPNGHPMISELSRGPFGSNRFQLTVGYQHEADSFGSVALAFRVGGMSGFTEQSFHEINGSSASLAAFDSDGRNQEWTGQWRKRVAPGLYASLKGGLAHMTFTENVTEFRTADSVRQIEYWLPSLSAGLGYIWRNRLFLSFDYKLANLRGSEHRFDPRLGDEDPVTREWNRRTSHGFHTWAQYHLPAGFFVGTGLTAYRADETAEGHYLPDSTGWRLDSWGRFRNEWEEETIPVRLHQFHATVGRRFGDRAFVEYELSRAYASSFEPWGHALLLRLSF
ncbi:MAG TPA: FecR family protein [Acidobacteriota bacterium]|nr:FecR family protein [Acidobacteriota bacterium]